MAKKRQISFYVDTEVWKEFSKKCIDMDSSKSEVLGELIRKYIKK